MFAREGDAEDLQTDSFHAVGPSVRLQGTSASPFVAISKLVGDGLGGEFFVATGGLTIPL